MTRPGDAYPLHPDQRGHPFVHDEAEVDWSVTVGEFVHSHNCTCIDCLDKLPGIPPSDEELALIARDSEDDRREERAREAWRVSIGLKAWRARNFPPQKESA